MATKLKLYNRALFHIGERKLSSLNENREPRRALDEVYDHALEFVLEQGFWKHSLRTVELEHSATFVHQFGYEFAFEKPTDFARLHRICQDEFLEVPLTDFSEEGDFWYANVDLLYVSYVSNDAAYGMDLSKWRASFTEYVALYLAHAVSNRLTPPADVGKQGNNNLERQLNDALRNALAKDAVEGPTQFLPPGSWANARRGSFGGGHGGRRDRGHRGNLIG